MLSQMLSKYEHKNFENDWKFRHLVFPLTFNQADLYENIFVYGTCELCNFSHAFIQFNCITLTAQARNLTSFLFYIYFAIQLDR